jgi:hypothetical protein
VYIRIPRGRTGNMKHMSSPSSEEKVFQRTHGLCDYGFFLHHLLLLLLFL